MLKRTILALSFFLSCFPVRSRDALVCGSSCEGSFAVHSTSSPAVIFCGSDDWEGVRIAAGNLARDFGRVCGKDASLCDAGEWNVAVGSVDKGQTIRSLLSKDELSSLAGCREKYLMIARDGRLIIAGSDKRGAIYGIYSLSRQMGVSPWYWWADVPVEHRDAVCVVPGSFTEGEPAVRYRGIFLNDEAPCLTSWVKNTFGTDYGGHEFYEKVFELVLRLKGNFMWPAMWGWAFYADDPLNSVTADRMGVIMGTSHHEPMARNHQEWARHRDSYGAWDYTTNRKVLDRFFAEGVSRAKDTEDLITIGMRGDGDTAMGAREGHDNEFVPNDSATIKLLERIVANQRRIISRITGRPAAERQQVWALYKEVQRYYDKGMKVPDDAIILLSDDNWGDIRRLPSAEELKGHKGGFGMYYHVDYVGAPRNTKWLNVTPIQHMWDQLELTWQYGVDRLWVLNVGDLKPMEYPISLFFDMAWSPDRYSASNLLDHTEAFCAEQFGTGYAAEAADILNLYSQYAGRVTPEMLDRNTYNLETGEWRAVRDELMSLETRALRLDRVLPDAYADAYAQLILFPVQALSNLYDMYYSQAMNHKLYSENNPEANLWADRTEAAFRRDASLCRSYNKDIAGGKWDGMMTQKHIGYTIWNDSFPADTLPEIFRFGDISGMKGGYEFESRDGVAVIDAEHYWSAVGAAGAAWTVIPYMGRTRSGISLQPYNAEVDGSSISYRVRIPEGAGTAEVHVICSSTLAFSRKSGHRYVVGLEGSDGVEVNFNGELNEEPENIYRLTYPTVASRVIEKVVRLDMTGEGKYRDIVIRPLDPGLVLEKIVVDFGGFRKEYLYSRESPGRRH